MFYGFSCIIPLITCTCMEADSKPSVSTGKHFWLLFLNVLCKLKWPVHWYMLGGQNNRNTTQYNAVLDNDTTDCFLQNDHEVESVPVNKHFLKTEHYYLIGGLIAGLLDCISLSKAKLIKQTWPISFRLNKSWVIIVGLWKQRLRFCTRIVTYLWLRSIYACDFISHSFHSSKQKLSHCHRKIRLCNRRIVLKSMKSQL